MTGMIMTLVLCAWLGLWGGFMVRRSERKDEGVPRAPIMNGDSGVVHIPHVSDKARALDEGEDQ